MYVMKRVQTGVLLLMGVLVLAGCAPKRTGRMDAARETNEVIRQSDTIKSYALKTDKTEVIPWISLDEEEQTFFIHYDVLSSYLAEGTYIKDEEHLILKTEDGKCQYQFDILKEDTLKFEQENSSGFAEINERLGKDIPDGAEFIMQ